MEYIFRARVQMLIPDLDKAIGFMGSRGILRVGCQDKLRELATGQRRDIDKEE